jgi:hypothetical protein
MAKQRLLMPLNIVNLENQIKELDKKLKYLIQELDFKIALN